MPSGLRFVMVMFGKSVKAGNELLRSDRVKFLFKVLTCQGLTLTAFHDAFIISDVHLSKIWGKKMQIQLPHSLASYVRGVYGEVKMEKNI